MAEALAKDIYKSKFSFSSAGTNALENLPPTQNAIDAMEKFGLSLSNHLSKQITKEHIDLNDLILTMTKWQKEFLASHFEQHSHKIFTLPEYVGVVKEIDDPFGLDVKAYIKCAEEIFKLLSLLN